MCEHGIEQDTRDDTERDGTEEDMFALFHRGCECYDETGRTAVHVLLGAAGGAALCRLHAFCIKLYREYLWREACRSSTALAQFVTKIGLAFICHAGSAHELDRSLDRCTSVVAQALHKCVGSPLQQQLDELQQRRHQSQEGDSSQGYAAIPSVEK